MTRIFTCVVALLFSFGVTAEVLKVGNSEIVYKIRDSKYNPALQKLNLEIEVQLVDGRLPSKNELKAVSTAVLKNQPEAKMRWVFYFLPKMKSGSGAYATDHRNPETEGVRVQEYMLLDTPYEHLVR